MMSWQFCAVSTSYTEGVVEKQLQIPKEVELSCVDTMQWKRAIIMYTELSVSLCTNEHQYLRTVKQLVDN